MAKPLPTSMAHHGGNSLGSLGDHPNQSSFGPKAKNPEGEGSFKCGLGPSHIVLKPPLQIALVH